MKNNVNWEYFKRFEKVNDKYLPDCGEGETMATQITTAINKLIYKWYNDGDVFDNNYYLEGWANDLSDYANWLSHYIDGAKNILDKIFSIGSKEEYEFILKELADEYLEENLLEMYDKKEKTGSIYNCKGEYCFNEYNYDDEEEEW